MYRNLHPKEGMIALSSIKGMTVQIVKTYTKDQDGNAVDGRLTDDVTLSMYSMQYIIYILTVISYTAGKETKSQEWLNGR